MERDAVSDKYATGRKKGGAKKEGQLLILPTPNCPKC